MDTTKPFAISKQAVWQGYRKVKDNRGAAGVDEQSLAQFEQDLKGNLYKLWNRMSSGTYFPPPVKLVEISKKDGSVRPLGVPTVADRIAQTVAAQELEKSVEPIFDDDSYGYRPGRSAHNALATCRQRCWTFDWAIDLDVKSFFDSVDHQLMLKAVAHHTDQRWILLYVQRWLQAPLAQPDGTLVERDRGTPQGSAISPMLADLYLHYAFDAWMRRVFPSVPFERILLIVDELDKVRDTRGLASFIKLSSSSTLKFLLVGIAQSVSDLLTDHQSLERMAIPVAVQRMAPSELEEIVTKAMTRLEEKRVQMEFARTAASRLSYIAGGFPWFVHVLGREALLTADAEGRGRVEIRHVEEAVDRLAEVRLAQQFSDAYQRAVRDSPNRERVLRLLARWSPQDIPTREVSRILRYSLDVRNPSHYIRQLSEDTFGRVLLRPPFHERGVVRFANEMFKRYVLMVPSLFVRVQSEVDHAWDNFMKEMRAEDGL